MTMLRKVENPTYLVMSFGTAELVVDAVRLPGHGVAVVAVR